MPEDSSTSFAMPRRRLVAACMSLMQVDQSSCAIAWISMAGVLQREGRVRLRRFAKQELTRKLLYIHTEKRMCIHGIPGFEGESILINAGACRLMIRGCEGAGSRGWPGYTGGKFNRVARVSQRAAFFEKPSLLDCASPTTTSGETPPSFARLRSLVHIPCILNFVVVVAVCMGKGARPAYPFNQIASASLLLINDLGGHHFFAEQLLNTSQLCAGICLDLHRCAAPHPDHGLYASKHRQSDSKGLPSHTTLTTESAALRQARTASHSSAPSCCQR